MDEQGAPHEVRPRIAVDRGSVAQGRGWTTAGPFRTLRPHIRRLSLVVAAFAAGMLQPLPGRAADTVHAAYVLYAESPGDGTVLLARVIVDRGTSCPSLEYGGRSVATIARRNPNPQTFPVTVCEALHPFGQAAKVAGTTVTLPQVKRRAERVVMIGDTGCKGVDEKGKGQDCSDPAAWPFAQFAKQAAESRPDAVIHVGDYNYIGTPREIPFAHGKSPRGVYDAGDHATPQDHCRLPGPFTSQNAPGSLLPDHWGHWRQDFFEPARPLLGAAPWVFTRGNHELCSRAGPGWFYFLSPSSTLLGEGARELSCPPQKGWLPVITIPPYRVDMGPIDVVVMDTPMACDRLRSPEFTETLADQFKTLTGMVGKKPTWLVTHRPIWAVHQASEKDKKFRDKPVKNAVINNKTLQLALKLGSGGTLPPSVGLVLAGHLHRFQSVTFASGRPPVLIVGDGGVKMDTDKPTGNFVATVDGANARVISENMFGYLAATVNRDGSWSGGWNGELTHRKKGYTARKNATCGTETLRHGSICMLGER